MISNCNSVVSLGGAVRRRQHHPPHSGFDAVAMGTKKQLDTSYNLRPRPNCPRPLARPSGPPPTPLSQCHRAAHDSVPRNRERQQFLPVSHSNRGSSLHRFQIYLSQCCFTVSVKPCLSSEPQSDQEKLPEKLRKSDWRGTDRQEVDTSENVVVALETKQWHQRSSWVQSGPSALRSVPLASALC